MGLLNTTKNLASLWVQGQKRKLASKGKPNSKVDSGGTRDDHSFEGQEIDRERLREVKEMRESGGIISHLVHAKAMMQFGTGASFQAEEDAAAEWLEDQFGDLDNLLIDIGEDALWFPAAYGEMVETNGGDFSHVELIEPWTTLPVEDEYGEIIAYEQQTKDDWGQNTETFNPDEIASFVLNKSSGRDKTGISEVLRAEDEVTHFKSNQKTINDALEFLVPHNHWIVGGENQSVIGDNELRRVRNMVQDMQGDTQFITGPDVQHDSIDLPKFDVKEITNNDLRQVCVALGVPIELGSVISEGLGSGEQSSVREDYFKLEKQAKQRALGGQFVEQIARILLRDYSDFDAEQELDLVFQESETIEEKKEVVDAIGGTLTVNEKRELFDYAPVDDPDVGESYDLPGESSEDDSNPFGGMFSEDEGDSPFLGKELSDDEFREFEASIERLHTDFVTAEDTSMTLTEFSEGQIPEMVKERMKQAIRSGAVFSHFEDLPSSELMDLRQSLQDMLTEDNWSLDNMAGELSETFDVPEDKAETWARTETQSIVNHSYEEALEDKGLKDSEVFKWVGDGNSDRTTDACKWLLGGDDLADNISGTGFEGTNPNYGGTPLPLDGLKEKIQEAAKHDPEINTQARTFTPHINCRKRYVRVVQ